MIRGKLSKPLATALYNHRIDPTKYPAADIIRKFDLKQQNTFYRMMYHAVMQQS